MKKLLFLLAATAGTMLHIEAQVISWAVPTGKYNKIEHCWGNLFLVYGDKGIGVIDGDGQEIVPPTASRITGFYGGWALALKAAGGQERVTGLVDTRGQYTKVDGTFYTIAGQEFFSEGLLPVTNSAGHAAYINTNGAQVHSFDDDYASPFAGGYAVVGEGQRFSIIDKSFKALHIPLPSFAPLAGGANVVDGSAIVWDGDGQFFRFFPKTGKVEPVKDKTITRQLKSFDFNYDYLGGIALLTGRSETVAYDEPERPAAALAATRQGEQYGYTKDGTVLLPCQLDEAEAFHAGRAIVKLHGQQGLLALHESGEMFQASTEAVIKYTQGKNKDLTHRFSLAVPSAWQGSELDVRVKDAGGFEHSVKRDGAAYTFLADGAARAASYSVELKAKDMKLWEGTLTYKYDVRVPQPDPAPIQPGSNFSKLSVSLRLVNDQANQDNRCCIKATIANPNPSAVTTRVSWTGTSLLEGSNTTVTVPAGGRTVVDIFIRVTKVATGNVTVRTAAGGEATLQGLQLIPFGI